MPNIFKSDLITAKDSLDVSTKSLSGQQTGAQVLYATAEYTFKPDGATPQEVTNDVIELADIPAGAVIVPQLSYVAQNFAGGGFSIALGDAAHGSRFGYVASNDTYGSGYLMPGLPCHAYFGYDAAEGSGPLPAATRVTARLDQAPAVSGSNKKLTFGIAYRVQG